MARNCAIEGYSMFKWLPGANGRHPKLAGTFNPIECARFRLSNSGPVLPSQRRFPALFQLVFESLENRKLLSCTVLQTADC